MSLKSEESFAIKYDNKENSDPIYILDEVDKSILSALDTNSRSSIADLSEITGLQRDRIMYRIKVLQKEGVLSQCTAAINPGRLGLTVYKLYLRLERNPVRQQRLLEFLQQSPHVFWICEGDGRWDLLIGTYHQSAQDFLDHLDTILDRFSDLIMLYQSNTLVYGEFYHKKYLTTSNQKSHFLIDENKRLVDVDSKDLKLLSSLCSDARLSLKELGAILGVSSNAAKYRLERLEKEGLIEGYRTILGLHRIGFSMFKAQLYMRTFDLKSVEELKQFCRSHPSITGFIRQLGEAPIEVEFEMESFHEYSIAREMLRERFSNLIREIATIEIRSQFYRFAFIDKLPGLIKN